VTRSTTEPKGEEMRFLVVDDSQSMRKIVTNCLKHLGYDEIIEAENGLVALTELAKGSVDVVITDRDMPEMDGLTLVQKMRADDRFKGIPIMMVAAESAKEDVITAIKAGVNNYVVRPFTAPVFREKLNRMLGH
jgi:two-component system chemotaxis response regulator CheY